MKAKARKASVNTTGPTPTTMKAIRAALEEKDKRKKQNNRDDARDSRIKKEAKTLFLKGDNVLRQNKQETASNDLEKVKNENEALKQAIANKMAEISYYKNLKSGNRDLHIGNGN